MIGGMRVDLAAARLSTIERGQLTGPDGTVFVRRGTRAKRRACDDAIALGSPLVLYYWAGGQLDWLEGEAAQHEWKAVRPAVTREPRPRGDLEWTAGVWQAEDGRTVLVLTGHC
jgi:hypothetical protein